MNVKVGRWVFLALLAALLGWMSPPRDALASHAGQEGAVARAVLFWTEGCEHCHEVLNSVLPPLLLKYGDQLDVEMIEIADTASYDYFTLVEDLYDLPPERRGVPALFIGDEVLVGSTEIPAELTRSIDACLAAGGCDWPPLPNLAAHIDIDEAICSPETPCPTTVPNNVSVTDSGAELATPVSDAGSAPFEGYWLGMAVMGVLVAALLYALVASALASIGRPVSLGVSSAPVAIPVLALLGMGVAGYLTFVEASNTAAVCGPVGDCNVVQSSPYAKLFGFLPVGLMGLAGYAAIIAGVMVARFGRGQLAALAPFAVLAMVLFGVLYTVYLTYVELAVIRAICAWCLASAVIMASVLVFAVGMALQSMRRDE